MPQFRNGIGRFPLGWRVRTNHTQDHNKNDVTVCYDRHIRCELDIVSGQCCFFLKPHPLGAIFTRIPDVGRLVVSAGGGKEAKSRPRTESESGFGMLSFTRKTDYALISLAHMARGQGSCCSAREIATHYGMPMPLLMNILKVLNQHGITRSIRGPRGGYQLAKAPKDVTLHDIIVAVDGPVALTHCLEKMIFDDAHAHEKNTSPSQEPCCTTASQAGAQDLEMGCKDHLHGKGNGTRPDPEDCSLKGVCPVRGQVHRVHHKLVAFLQEVTLADIVERAVWRGGVGDLVSTDLPATAVFADPTNGGVTRHEVAHLPG